MLILTPACPNGPLSSSVLSTENFGQPKGIWDRGISAESAASEGKKSGSYVGQILSRD